MPNKVELESACTAIAGRTRAQLRAKVHDIINNKQKLSTKNMVSEKLVQTNSKLESTPCSQLLCVKFQYIGQYNEK